MDKEEDEDFIHDKKIDEIERKYMQLDDVCREIFLTLQAYRRLRFNELQRFLKKFGTDISNQSLIDHLKHLMKVKLISSKKGFQYASYGLTDEVLSLLNPPEEDLKEWLVAATEEGERALPEDLKSKPFYAKDFFSKLSDRELEEQIDKDIQRVITHNLFELKTLIDYDLKLDRPESNRQFWTFIGNPLYRMTESQIAENCRSDRYREKLFEKIDVLIDDLRADKEEAKRKEERRKKRATNNSHKA
jgi:DNA-binding HxlR family transcriptional regulator